MVEVDEVPRVVDLADGAGVAAQAVAGAAAHAQDRRARRRRGGRDARDHELGLVVLGHLEGARAPGGGHRPDDAREAEHPGGAAVDVEGVEVPPAVPRHERPRLDAALGRLRFLRAPVREAERHAAQHAVLDGVERRLGRAQPRLDADEGVDVALDPGRAQLAQGLGRRAGEARLGPGAAGEAEHGQLVGLEGDVGQRVLALVDAVPRLVLVERVDVLGDERDAELAQLVLVALEHPLEGLGRGRLAVLRHELADLGLGQGSSRVQQDEHEVEESLGLHLRRRRGARDGLAAHRPDATRRIRCGP